MIYLDKIYEDFTSSDKIFSLLESHGIVVSKYSSIAPNLRTVLEKSINEEAITRDEALMLSKVNSSEIPFLMAAANFIRTKHKGNLITFSKNIFIPLTQLCRDQCSYCTFKIEPHEGDLLIEPEDVLESAKKAVKLGCTELLFVSGDRPENIYDVYQKKLESMGYRSTADYMIAMSEICLEEGIFPHSNLGIARIDELKRFKPTPVQEAKWGLAVIEDSLWNSVPKICSRVDEAVQKYSGKKLPISPNPAAPNNASAIE